MMLIRRFEERAGEMYAKAKIGGFLHLAIGEEGTIVGAARAMRDEDYLISTYRSHGHAIVRGTARTTSWPSSSAASTDARTGAAGRCTCSTSSGASWVATASSAATCRSPPGMGLAAELLGTEDATLCQFGDGAANQGTFGEALNLAALWKLPVVFMVTNNQFGMGTALERHSAVTDLHKRGEGFGVPGMRCDGMDVLDTFNVTREALRARPRGASADARRGDHLPLPRALDGRPRGVPHQGAGRGVAPARPDQLVRPAPGRRGRDRRARPRRARRPGRRAPSTRR